MVTMYLDSAIIVKLLVREEDVLAFRGRGHSTTAAQILDGKMAIFEDREGGRGGWT